MASLPLSSSHSNRPANPHPDAPSQSLPCCCCCARPDCAVVRQNQSALDRLESDLETAARLGQVCSFLFIRKITILYIDSCIPYLYCPSPLAFRFLFCFPPPPFLVHRTWLRSSKTCLHTLCYCYCPCVSPLNLYMPRWTPPQAYVPAV